MDRQEAVVEYKEDFARKCVIEWVLRKRCIITYGYAADGIALLSYGIPSFVQFQPCRISADPLAPVQRQGRKSAIA
jgi:hypothetical protein